jgi:hypothetical protein
MNGTVAPSPNNLAVAATERALMPVSRAMRSRWLARRESAGAFMSGKV